MAQSEYVTAHIVARRWLVAVRRLLPFRSIVSVVGEDIEILRM